MESSHQLSAQKLPICRKEKSESFPHLSSGQIPQCHPLLPSSLANSMVESIKYFHNLTMALAYIAYSLTGLTSESWNRTFSRSCDPLYNQFPFRNQMNGQQNTNLRKSDHHLIVGACKWQFTVHCNKSRNTQPHIPS
ncbi:uncharacterized protein J3R85_021002 [Psidium guajava]|nr:uncharacterized protein J3R85_021002 [Psidium guajava]